VEWMEKKYGKRMEGDKGTKWIKERKRMRH
jgi:hypothetical protein